MEELRLVELEVVAEGVALVKVEVGPARVDSFVVPLEAENVVAVAELVLLAAVKPQQCQQFDPDRTLTTVQKQVNVCFSECV